jgi:hypothetical protein
MRPVQKSLQIGELIVVAIVAILSGFRDYDVGFLALAGQF